MLGAEQLIRMGYDRPIHQEQGVYNVCEVLKCKMWRHVSIGNTSNRARAIAAGANALWSPLAEPQCGGHE